MIVELFKQALLSFISTVGFAYILLVPKSKLLYSGLSGMAGWSVYWIAVALGFSTVTGSFFGALMLAALSYRFAVKLKTPATLYNIPGIVALVPGAVSYQMTYAFIRGEYDQAIFYGIKVSALAGAIAAGLIGFDLIRKILLRIKATYKK